MLRGEADLTQPGGRLMCLALGLLFLHRQGAVDATLEVRCRTEAALNTAGPPCLAKPSAWGLLLNSAIVRMGQVANTAGRACVPQGTRPARFTNLARCCPPFQSCQVAKTLDERVSRFLQVVLDVCAYAGTGDVLKARLVAAIVLLCSSDAWMGICSLWRLRLPWFPGQPCLRTNAVATCLMFQCLLHPVRPAGAAAAGAVRGAH